MAGYDFTLSLPHKYRDVGRKWVRLFWLEGRRRSLAVKWRCEVASSDKIEFFIRVDGQLDEMQSLQRDLPGLGEVFVLTVPDGRSCSFKASSAGAVIQVSTSSGVVSQPGGAQ